MEGTVDLAAAIALTIIHGASAFMGAADRIPAFWVPALLVTHYITFVVLLKYWEKGIGSSMDRRSVRIVYAV